MASTVITLDGFDMKKLIDGDEIEMPILNNFCDVERIIIKTTPNASQYIREALKGE